MVNKSNDLADWLQIGAIVGAQGLRGEVRIYPTTDFPERFEEPGQRWLLHPDQDQPEPIELVQGRYVQGKGLYVVQLAGVTTRDQAEALLDCRLFVPASDRPPLEAGEFHVPDLIGLEVFDQTTQTAIGTVVTVVPAGNDLLEVELYAQSTPESTEDAAAAPALEAPSSDRRKRHRSKRPKPNKPKTILIPFVEEIVPIVDLEQGRIEVSPPPGLLD